jgi:hypothetical protein
MRWKLMVKTNVGLLTRVNGQKESPPQATQNCSKLYSRKMESHSQSWHPLPYSGESQK